MKNIKYIIGLFLTILFTNCEEPSYEFGDIITPSDIQITAEIVGQDADHPYGDGSGVVNFNATANNALVFKYIYNGSELLAPKGSASLNFSNTGINTYSVTVVASGTAGVSSSKTIDVEVLALYEAPDDLLEMLHGDGEKTWRVKAESPAHFGVGPADETSPIWWGAAPFDKADKGGYDDRITFKSDGTVLYVSNGTIYGQAAQLDTDFGITWEANADNEYENYPVDDFTDTWELTAPGGQETLTFGDKGYHGFYVGGDHSYQILERSATEMTIKTVGTDGNGWFAILTTAPEVSDEFVSQYTNLVWSDEFDTDGAPDGTKWGYDLGAGGWGNNEVQTYTNDATNVIVDGGFLKINAIKNGSDYTSARLKSQGLYSFTYGRVDVRAKLPASAGTWPAIWMLGDSFSTVGWPKCGEIDIMEQTGADKNTTLGTFHWFDTGTNATASYGESTSVGTSTTDFHDYTLEWTAEKVIVLVDNVPFVTIDNNDDLPFDADFFLILNIAMGGTLGGDIDPAFTQDTMEIDYVRVYQ